MTDEAELRARVKALEALLVERGLIGTDTVDRIVEVYESEIGPLLGARVVAHAWTNPDFKQRLLADATAACWELDIGGLQGEKLVAVENTPEVHNVVVCTLCSCYPWPVLGIPPNWYKSPEYRARMVAEPRVVLAEDFGVVLGEDVEIRVQDSSAEMRYFTVPQRPAGTEDWDEERLAGIVTRESMVGVAVL
ncbi:nitrile hydratase subunit alpha [Lentzea sp. NBRC 105346]|uniref:nitrile hydratase subunit alpha n=1 Tax=Lentzea sp. NBRC 105346 TaxID=3032205 RepID=UPI0024A39601|nr:nitrile hydratase subunit alpha [Lentzea sp. NBRC 105346]GLZ35177.1 nitrile hydratase subunit alpha [Lentzea sp. NBRC 105346]